MSKLGDDMRIVVVAATNNEAILKRNLERSPLFKDGNIDLYLVNKPPSAAIAYNEAIENTSSDVIIFAHQDVYLPRGWDVLLRNRIAAISFKDPSWALLGPFGVSEGGQLYGPVWSSSLGSIVGRTPIEPVSVQSYDELLLVMRRDSGLRFDDALPHFHLYGTDIVQTARSRNFSCYAASLPLIHNDVSHGHLGEDFRECYEFIKRKWRSELPLATPITNITWHDWQFRKAMWRNKRSKMFIYKMAVPNQEDPKRYADLCGWNDLSNCSVQLYR